MPVVRFCAHSTAAHSKDTLANTKTQDSSSMLAGLENANASLRPSDDSSRCQIMILINRAANEHTAAFAVLRVLCGLILSKR
jgi:hypothetical protein